MTTDVLTAEFGSVLAWVSPEAADRYSLLGSTLCERVNRSLSERPDVESLIGGASLEIMRSNHHHHRLLMEAVFQLRAPSLLLNTVPWVYRSYHARGFSYDYFSIELEAWRDAVVSLLGHEFGAGIAKVYEWLLSHHTVFISRSQAPVTTEIAVPPPWDRVADQFVTLLLQGDHRGCVRLAEESVADDRDLDAFYLYVIQPSLYEIGRLWEIGEISVATEHLASSIVARVIAAQTVARKPLPSTRGSAVVCAVGDEHHEIGAWMLAELLERDGWHVDYLGGNTPSVDFVRFLLDAEPFFAALSVTVPTNLQEAGRVIRAIRAEEPLRGTRVLVGGQALNANPGLWRSLRADATATDAVEAVGMVRAWSRTQ